MKWFLNLRTATKLGMSFGAMLVLVVMVGVIGLSAAADSNAGIETTYKRDLTGLDVARSVQIRLLEIGRYFRAGMLSPEEAKKAVFVQDLERADAELRRDLDELEKLVILPESKARIEEAKRLAPEYSAHAQEAVRLSSTDMKAALVLHATITEMGSHMASLAETVAVSKKDVAQTTYSDSLARYAHSRNVVVGATLLSMLVGVFFAFVVSRAIAEPLKQTVGVLERVAAGDLSARLELDRTDEIGMMGSALNQSLEAIRQTLANVQEVSVEVSSASSELASSAQQISSGAQEQAASLEETAASLEEISSTVKQNTDNAQHASQLASGARDAAERGGRVVESAVLAMSEITKSSKKIADIITTIDEIAFQTNLLALNAAVEAARAGEQGRGFGVVAAEVRSLAQRTGSAAKEIRSLIADSTNKVEVGTQQVNHSGETLAEIVKSVKRVTDMVAEIAAASREQNTGLDQVNTAVAQVDQVTQLNASQTEELSATATSLSDKSAQLQELVAAFDLGTGSSAPVRSSARQPAARHAAPAASVVTRKAATSPSLRVVRGSSSRLPALKVANGTEEF